MIQQPDGKDIDTLYRNHMHDLFSYALNLGFDRETAMDAIHDVFCKICTDKKSLEKVENIRFYLLRMLKNRLLDIYKLKKEISGLPTDAITGDMPFTVHVSVEDSLIESEEQDLIRAKVEQLLESLTDRQREIIYLRYMQGLAYEEIALLMHITVPACRKLFHKGISNLRKNPPVALLFFMVAL
jgi:RNA polymerase sigma factor (sigma-70 family)